MEDLNSHGESDIILNGQEVNLNVMLEEHLHAFTMYYKILRKRVFKGNSAKKLQRQQHFKVVQSLHAMVTSHFRSKEPASVLCLAENHDNTVKYFRVWSRIVNGASRQ